MLFRPRPERFGIIPTLHSPTHFLFLSPHLLKSTSVTVILRDICTQPSPEPPRPNVKGMFNGVGKSIRVIFRNWWCSRPFPPSSFLSHSLQQATEQSTTRRINHDKRRRLRRRRGKSPPSPSFPLRGKSPEGATRNSPSTIAKLGAQS